MPTLDAIAEAGPWVVLVFCLMVGIAGLFTAFVKKLLVPGWLYDRLFEDWKVLKEQGDRNAKALEAMAEREHHSHASERHR